MALPTGQPAAGMQDGNLKSLLDAIDRKTAPALQQDLERLHSRAGRSADRVLHISFVVGTVFPSPGTQSARYACASAANSSAGPLCS